MNSSTSSPSPSQALFDASCKGDLAGVNRALRDEADPQVTFEYVDDSGRRVKNSSFLVAKRTQYCRITLLLILELINFINKDYGHNHIVERLKGTLFYACENGDLESATEALKNGANLNGMYIFNHENSRGSSLHAASRAFIYELSIIYTYFSPFLGNGHFDIVQLLLSHKSIDVNAQNDNGYTALFWAAYKGHTEIVKILLGVETIEEINFMQLHFIGVLVGDMVLVYKQMVVIGD